MAVNMKLLTAIREKGIRQRDFAALVGEDESVVSRVINGVWKADPIRKAKYARALKMRVADLFPETE